MFGSGGFEQGTYADGTIYPMYWFCLAGTYGGLSQGKKDISECLVCPAGYWCGDHCVTPTPVGAGYYSPHTGLSLASQALICPPKFHCPESAMTNYKGYHCAKGHYCPAGSTSPTQETCPPGTYSDATDLHDVRDCMICPEGFMCAEAATSDNDLIVICPVGWYCPEGSEYFVDEGEQTNWDNFFLVHWETMHGSRFHSKIMCPPGLHSYIEGSRTLEDCVPCPAGVYCHFAEPIICPPGYYCPERTEYETQYPCPAGTYNENEGAVDIGQCLACQVGNFCPEASPEQTLCLPGTYYAESNFGAECTQCPLGSFCPDYGMLEPLPCPAGCFSNSSAALC